ncbi:putative F-box protein At5g55150 [Asparagus officinalis]|uniref:putative F-box protein At5g55150 n=1 Tax=Asparagus officinalis TaxID=4686 RepID=UPI00098E20A6|nr:putative F-box protein At5g55150 [Asparagus officinalis]
MGSLDGLPIDILRLIVEKIVGHADVIRFGAVSRKFRSFVMDNIHSLPSKLPLCLCVLPSKPPPLPMLMQCNDNEWENINFFSISDGKRHGEFVVPEIRNKWPVGSRYGWLFTVDTQGRSIQLLNPLTRAQIPLPSLDAFEHPTSWVNYDEHTDFRFVLKGVISSDPSNKRRNLNGDEDCILVIAIITMFEVLSFCRVGDDKWTNVEGSPLYIKDVIWYKGEVYAVDEYGVAVVYDFAGDKTIKQIAYSPDDLLDCERYLVVLTNGDLLQVVREREYGQIKKKMALPVL